MMCEIGRRVRWLLDVLAVNSRDVGSALAGHLGTDERSATDMVAGVRDGTSTVPLRNDQLTVLAEYCGVSPAYFGDDSAAVETIRTNVMVRALRELDACPYLLCRMPVSSSERWEQLRWTLQLLRRLSCADTHVPIGNEQDSAQHVTDDQIGRSMYEVSGMTTGLSEEQLDALCTRVVDECGLLPPFGPRDLCSRLGQLRGRRIKITATHLGTTTGVGHLAPTQKTDRIFVEQNAPVHQQELVIYHEVLHLLRGHLDLDDGITCGIADASPSDWREWEAEVGARALARIARQRRRPNQLSPSHESPDHNIAAAFGLT